MQTTPKTIQLFKSPFLEKLTRIHPAGPILFWGPTVLTILAICWIKFELSLLTWVSLALLGFFIWTGFEYFLHRVLFHYPAKSELGKRWIYIFHGVHHEDPYDKYRSVMPIVPGVIYSIPIYLIFMVMVGTQRAPILFSFFIIGYLFYDYIHYGTHHFVPKTAIGKYLRKYHRTHHVHAGVRFGVTGPLWDIMFGTYKLPVKGVSHKKVNEKKKTVA